MIGRGVEIETDPKLLRPTDEPIIYGDSSRLKAHTGWEQQYDLRTTITDMVDYLRTKKSCKMTLARRTLFGLELINDDSFDATIDSMMQFSTQYDAAAGKVSTAVHTECG